MVTLYLLLLIFSFLDLLMIVDVFYSNNDPINNSKAIVPSVRLKSSTSVKITPIISSFYNNQIKRRSRNNSGSNKKKDTEYACIKKAITYLGQ